MLTGNATEWQSPILGRVSAGPAANLSDADGRLPLGTDSGSGTGKPVAPVTPNSDISLSRDAVILPPATLAVIDLASA
jgi:hypothetical protein